MAGLDGRPGWLAGRARWDGWQGGMAGFAVGWQAGLDGGTVGMAGGWQGDWRAMKLQSKECSQVYLEP